MLSSELVDGLLALNVSTLDDAKALSVEKLLTLPGLSKKGAAQKLKDRLGEILPCGYTIHTLRKFNFTLQQHASLTSDPRPLDR